MVTEFQSQRGDLALLKGLLAAHEAREAQAFRAALRPFVLISVCFIVFSATMAALIAVLREPFAEPQGTALAKAVIAFGAVSFAWLEANALLLTKRLSSYGAALLLALIALALPAVAGLHPFAAAAVYPVLAGLWIAGLHRVVQVSDSAFLLQSVAAAIGLCIIAAIYFLLVNGAGYATALSPEAALTGDQHSDTLFHTTLSAFLTKFGVLSIGADGLVPTQYHFLSHAWIGLAGSWLELPPLHAYYALSQIILIPLLLFSLCAATCSLAARSGEKQVPFMAILLPISLLWSVDLATWTSYLVSESYFFSLSLFLLSLPLLCCLIDETPPRTKLPQVAVGIFVVLLMTLAKLSVGLIYASGFGYIILTTYGRNPALLIPLVLGTVAAATAALVLVIPEAHTIYAQIDLLHFVRAYPDGAWGNLAAIAVTLAIALLRQRSGSSQERRLGQAVAVLAMASLVPALTMRIGGGSAYYFLNVGSWVGIVYVSAWIIRLGMIRPAMPAMAAALAAAVAVAAFLGSDAKRHSFDRFRAEIAQLRDRVAGPNPTRPDEDGGSSWFAAWAGLRQDLAWIDGHIDQSVGGRIVRSLAGLDILGRRDTLVFVPPANVGFWQLNERCLGQPLLIPALVGLPMINGLTPPGFDCDLGRAYGYTSYGEDSRSSPQSDEALCRKAGRLGFRQVAVVESPDEARLLPCASSHEAFGSAP